MLSDAARRFSGRHPAAWHLTLSHLRFCKCCLVPPLRSSLDMSSSIRGRATTMMGLRTGSLRFRLVLGLGAVPACLALAASWGEARRTFAAAWRDYVLPVVTGVDADGSCSWGPASGQPQIQGRRQPCCQLGKPKALHSHRRTLIGTAGTWFLFDVAAYGPSAAIQKQTDERQSRSEQGIRAWLCLCWSDWKAPSSSLLAS